MPEFKNKEEYEKWKAEKIKVNAATLQKGEEEERLKHAQTNNSPPDQKKQVKKWSQWGFLRTVSFGVIVCFLFAVSRLIIGLERFSFIIDNLQFLLVLLVATKYKGSIVLKVVAFFLIPLVAYTLGALLLLFGIGLGAHSVPSMSY
jgi:hypothetical protein